MKRHVVLVGLPGSGKTTVGRLVAERLGTTVVDLDAAIVRRMQMPVARIFGEFGEQRFREVEREQMAIALDGEPAIITPGGGWAAQPGAMQGLRERALTIFLRVLPSTAAHRVDESEMRPLLSGGNVLERMRQLVAEREASYRLAEVEIRNDPPRTAAQAADEVLALARQRAGW
ncbi:MAG TPA: shikimate kinase [Gemmatimonadales bacterium]|nr:shikimate kinase [Gemmatimonadales bacterium]